MKIDLNDGNRERMIARNWYFWLWISPVFTILTFGAIGFMAARSCGLSLTDEEFSSSVTVISSLWHVILLIPLLSRRPFVRWHGFQALVLVFVQKSLLYALFLVRDEVSVVLLLLLIAVWFLGTLLSQKEAAKGRCALRRLFGREEAPIAEA